MMNANCTCGARLPEDARFCHKCGKPQFDEVAEEAPVVVEEVAPAPVAPQQALPITFRNAVAVRIGLTVSFLVALALAMPMPSFFAAIWQFIVLPAAGFGSVYLYHRRTGEFLSVRSGARMGWITGIFCFLIMLVMFTVGIAVVANSGGIGQVFGDALAANSTPQVAEKFKEVLESPAGVGAVLFGMIAGSFLMAAILSMVGGALGAKVLEKE